MTQPPAPLQGVINLDKPAGISSARAVNLVKRRLPRGTKIGHAGTLDPFATGVLLLLVGKATKLCESLMDQPKQYRATVKLGATTPTDDPESEEIAVLGAVTPTPVQVQEALGKFVGEILQTPPVYSAMKVDGRRAYDLARRGNDVKLDPRPVKVYALELIGFRWPYVKVTIDCGRGTYIRAIARDLGQALACGAHLTELTRTKVGSFTLDDAVSLEQIEREPMASLIALNAVD
jgi:tRNA pseudouridine55 synthase